MEEFTLRFLDPLKYGDLRDRRMFALNPKLNVRLETAIRLEQKKVIPLISLCNSGGSTLAFTTALNIK